MKINDEITKSVAETVAELLEKQKIKTETEVQKANKDFVDLHAVDDKEDPEQKKQVESKDEVEDDVEEGNAFGQAVTDAKKAGKKKFKFQGKEYKVESAELEEASASDIKKVLAAAKKAGGTVKGNQIDFGMGSVIDVSIEKDKIKLDGGSSSGVEYFKNAKDAIMTFESVELEEAVDNFFGFPTKDKLVKFQSMAKKLKIKSISNPTVLKRGGKEFHVMGFEGSVSDIEKAMRVADGIIKESAELEEMFNRLKPDDVRDAYGTIELKYRSSADIRDAEDKLKKAGINVRKNRDTLEVDSDSPAFKKAKITSTFDSSKREKAVLKVLEESVELQEASFNDIEKVIKHFKDFFKGKQVKRFPQLDISKKYGTAFINLSIFNIITLRLGGKKGIVVTHDDRTNGKGNAKEEHFSNANEVIKFVEKKYNEMPKKESIEEAVKPADFVKGGDTKITKREVDGMLSKLFIDAKLAKAVEASSAFKAGEKSNGKKNPYNKDTADFHLFILGQQSADAE